MATSPAAPAPANDPSGPSVAGDAATSFDLGERNSLELVIAFVGPVGSGVSTVCHQIIDTLTERFDYDTHYIKVSDLIRRHSVEVHVDLPDHLEANERVDRYQDAGNKLRSLRSTYLADRAIEEINAYRRDNEGVKLQVNAPDIAVQRRTAYLIDSLKNPDEVRRFRQIYGDLFWLVTVFAPDEVRERRLIANDYDENAVRYIMNRDEEEGTRTGQQVSKTAHLADYFVRNNTDIKENVRPSTDRFLDSIFGTKLYTPTKDETGMMKAASAALRSACMSRQVGASIYSEQGELIGVGCNDVPKSGGGLYSSDMNPDEDKRCYHWGGKICHNDHRKQKLANSITNKILDGDGNDFGKFDDIFDRVSKSDSRNLIEFSRSVHAEMEAIVSVARSGKGSTLNGTLFTTTFPCHNCARHIVAAGISRVVFIEPYSKSLALDLHHDSITLSDESGKVRFVQYEGFAPRSSLRVFSSVGRDRKDEKGRFSEVSSRNASPLFPHPLDSYMTSEELIIQELTKLQETVDGKAKVDRGVS
jgi:deoxycytidylate deaminase